MIRLGPILWCVLYYVEQLYVRYKKLLVPQVDALRTVELLKDPALEHTVREVFGQGRHLVADPIHCKSFL